MYRQLLISILATCQVLAQLLEDPCGFPLIDDVNVCAGGTQVSLGGRLDSLTCSFELQSRGDGIPDTSGTKTSGILCIRPITDGSLSFPLIKPIQKGATFNLTDGVLGDKLNGNSLSLFYGGDLAKYAGLLFDFEPPKNYKPLRLQAGHQCINGAP